jgi:hypothetical protein
MALKFGRTSGMTSSIDPVTGRIRYDKAEYDANVAAIASEASRKKDYDASVAKFKTDSDTYYGRSAVDTKGAAKIASAYNAAGNRGSKGQSYTATGAGSKTQEQMDKEFDAMVKSNQIVPFNDPSITAKTRELYTGANYGEDLSKKYIRKDNYNSYREIFGEDYNPLQKKKDALAGKLNQYELQTVHEPIVDIGTFSRVGAPVGPGPYVPVDIKPIDINDVDFPPPPPPPPPKEKKPKEPVVVEKDAFVTPEKRYKIPKKVSMNPLAKGARQPEKWKNYAGQVGEAIGSRVKNVLKGNVNKGYMREQKLFYDTYGGGETIGKEGFGDMSLGEVRDLKKTIRKDQDLSRSDFKEGKRDLNSAIRLKKLESKDKVNFWTEGKGKEYRNSADYETSRAAYKSQTENATNSNTIANQQAKNGQAKLGEEATNAAPTSYFGTRSQMKDKYREMNPTASKQEVRKGVRTEIQTNKQTQIDLRKKEKEKGMY